MNTPAESRPSVDAAELVNHVFTTVLPDLRAHHALREGLFERELAIALLAWKHEKERADAAEAQMRVLQQHLDDTPLGDG